MPKALPSTMSQATYLAVAALFLILPYFGTLTAPFDFVDDGILPYRKAGSFTEHVWRDTQSEFHSRGPFRPITWAHWEAAAGLFGDQPIPHRLTRLASAYLTAALWLWFFLELGLPRRTTLLTGAVAMWIPYRNEIWLGLGLTEAFAMPYALLGLIASIRASRSERPWPWDATAWCCALLAIGCKNTFAAIVPAQIYLRMVGAGLPWREAWRQHRWRACLLATVLVFPVWHLAAYALDAAPKEYQVRAFGRLNVLLWLCAMMDSVGLEYVGAGLVILGVVWWRARQAHVNPNASTQSARPALGTRQLSIAAGLLAICGVGIYLPVPLICGRYTVPAAWGVDLVIALLLAGVVACPVSRWKRVGYCVLGAGLLVAVAFNLEGQNKYAARSEVLWRALRHCEAEVPANATVVWWGRQGANDDELAISEGIHFNWHVERRHCKQLTLLYPHQFTPERIRQVSFVISGGSTPPGEGLELLRDFSVPFGWAGQAQHCYLWKVRSRPGGPGQPMSPGTLTSPSVVQQDQTESNVMRRLQSSIP